MNTSSMIDTFAQQLRNTFNKNTITPNDADAVGDMVAAAADWFEKNPNRWVSGQYHMEDRFCNVGLLSAEWNSPLYKTFTLEQRAAWRRQNRITDALIELNDAYAASYRLNIIGLRMMADILYHIATPGWTPIESIDTVAAEYHAWYGKNVKLAKDEASARRERKNQQVREARRAAKLGGYKSVTQMRKAAVGLAA